MKVLLSIKPEFALKIFDGSKRYEYRRTIFKRIGVKTVVVYASEPISRVIGEFEIGEILCGEPEELWLKTYRNAGITKKQFLEYFVNQAKGYAIEIKEVQKYEPPRLLKEFVRSGPPRSFMYLYTDSISYLSDIFENSSVQKPNYFDAKIPSE